MKEAVCNFEVGEWRDIYGNPIDPDAVEEIVGEPCVVTKIDIFSKTITVSKVKEPE